MDDSANSFTDNDLGAGAVTTKTGLLLPIVAGRMSAANGTPPPFVAGISPPAPLPSGLALLRAPEAGQHVAQEALDDSVLERFTDPALGDGRSSYTHHVPPQRRSLDFEPTHRVGRHMKNPTMPAKRLPSLPEARSRPVSEMPPMQSSVRRGSSLPLCLHARRQGDCDSPPTLASPLLLFWEIADAGQPGGRVRRQQPPRLRPHRVEVALNVSLRRSLSTATSPSTPARLRPSGNCIPADNTRAPHPNDAAG